MTTKKAVRSVRLYEIAPGKSNKNVELEGQGAIVLEVLKKAQPASMAEIASAAGKRLKSKQEPIRVVNHYIGKFKAANLVRVAKKVKSAA